MNELNFSFNIILICFAFALPIANARSFSKTENGLNFTKSIEIDASSLRANDPYDCASYSWSCPECVVKMCFYCSKTGVCSSSSDFGNECPLKDRYYSTCPRGNLTAVYIGVAVGCVVILIVKGIVLYCIFKRRKRVRSGRVVGGITHIGSTGIVQASQGISDINKATVSYSALRENINNSPDAKY